MLTFQKAWSRVIVTVALANAGFQFRPKADTSEPDRNGLGNQKKDDVGSLLDSA